MSLEHSFRIVENRDNMEIVSVPDEIVTYINDSMYWIVSLWNKKMLIMDCHIMERQ